MTLVLLVPATESGSQEGVVGLALSFNTISKVFVSTLLTTIQRASNFPSSVKKTTRHIAAGPPQFLELVICCVNSLGFVVIRVAAAELYARLVRIYGDPPTIPRVIE
ncbi:hypothetical protein PI125_g9298 [Phytophthora idaei]|nr:hypothetical protein PI125_g9298 [Phytophthora idaei]